LNPFGSRSHRPHQAANTGPSEIGAFAFWMKKNGFRDSTILGIEAGFEFVLQKDDLAYFRKRK